MNRTVIALAALGFFAVGCQETDPTTPLTDGLGVTPQANMNRVVHHASFGGADVCTGLGFAPGCDANFSGTANKKADGSVKGQWHDTLNFGGPGGIVPVHMAIDCLHVSGNHAWVSGVVTNQPFAGIPVITRVADNGKSAKDPTDQISFLFVDNFGGCTATPDLPLIDANEGQVTVF